MVGCDDAYDSYVWRRALNKIFLYHVQIQDFNSNTSQVTVCDIFYDVKTFVSSRRLPLNLWILSKQRPKHHGL